MHLFCEASAVRPDRAPEEPRTEGGSPDKEANNTPLKISPSAELLGPAITRKQRGHTSRLLLLFPR